jgi:hypothetical protein
MIPGTNSAYFTPRRDALDSARSLSGLEKFFPPLSGEAFLPTEGEGGQRVLVWATPQ